MMGNKVKFVFIVSLVLNAVLVIGFWVYHNFAKSQIFKMAVMVPQAEKNLIVSILPELESGDSERITALEERLRMNIENAEKVEASS